MKKNLKLRPFVLPTIYALSVITLIISIYYAANTLKTSEDEYYTYVTSSIMDTDIPVIATDIKLIRPYTNTEVTIGKSYYDYKAEKEEQENSITYYENTYMQNAGVDYVLKDTFEVVSILDGTVIDVKEDDIVGKTITIKHDDKIVSVYQSLSEVNVKKDDQVTQGQIIGKSGTNKLEKDLGNHLYFELSIDGSVVNPEDYYDKKVNEI